jgi:hypothetical protein
LGCLALASVTMFLDRSVNALLISLISRRISSLKCDLTLNILKRLVSHLSALSKLYPPRLGRPASPSGLGILNPWEAMDDKEEPVDSGLVCSTENETALVTLGAGELE